MRSRHRIAVIAPRAALVVDDVGDIGIAQYAGKRRHSTGVDSASGLAALNTVEDYLHMFRRIGRRGAFTEKRRRTEGGNDREREARFRA